MFKDRELCAGYRLSVDLLSKGFTSATTSYDEKFLCSDMVMIADSIIVSLSYYGRIEKQDRSDEGHFWIFGYVISYKL